MKSKSATCLLCQSQPNKHHTLGKSKEGRDCSSRSEVTLGSRAVHFFEVSEKGFLRSWGGTAKHLTFTTQQTSYTIACLIALSLKTWDVVPNSRESSRDIHRQTALTQQKFFIEGNLWDIQRVQAFQLRNPNKQQHIRALFKATWSLSPLQQQRSDHSATWEASNDSNASAFLAPPCYEALQDFYWPKDDLDRSSLDQSVSD